MSDNAFMALAFAAFIAWFLLLASGDPAGAAILTGFLSLMAFMRASLLGGTR